MKINFKLNGQKYSLDVEPYEILLEMLRDRVGVKSPKCGCNRGDCGTCTVLLNGKTVRSCLVLAIEIDGAEITTLEGLMADGKLTPLQESFLAHNSFQCGFCASGMLLSTTELLEENPAPSKEEIKETLSGNLCRCTGYTPIIEAISDQAERRNKIWVS
ncbi:MAG TPA: (2Fe-2S)-binding protein [candidate division Zixibacteria bacterium]|nr:(2Fe-2S)-binding protein [candidate division Zixibacteria bacterium]HBZ00215.1 (2Fe-2S)-binding protein [candidate division Zixibacteria bacterium]